MVHDVEGGQLVERIKELEARLDLLEEILIRTGSGVQIALGDSGIFVDSSAVRIQSTEIILEAKKVVVNADRDIDLNSNNTAIKASSTLTMKASKVVEN
jgi:hypothetical protein